MSVGQQLLDAREAFHLGAYAKVRALLASVSPSPERARVALRTALRERDYVAVANAADELQTHAQTDDDLAVGEAYTSFARAALGESVTDLTVSVTALNAETRAELAFVRAMLAWMNDDIGRIESLLRTDAPQTVEQQIRRISILAWAAGSARNYRRQAELLLNALVRALNEPLDAGMIVGLAHPLAVLLRELELEDLSAHAEATLRRVPWTSVDIPDSHNGIRAVAWRYALNGQYEPALTLLEEAAHLAPNALARAVSYSDKARVALAVNAQTHFIAALDIAFRQFERVDWTNVSLEESLGFYGAIDVLQYDADRARRLFETIDDEQIARSLGAAHGDRVAGYRAYAQAMLTDGHAGVDASRRAYRISKATTTSFAPPAPRFALMTSRAIVYGSNESNRLRNATPSRYLLKNCSSAPAAGKVYPDAASRFSKLYAMVARSHKQAKRSTCLRTPFGHISADYIKSSASNVEPNSFGKRSKSTTPRSLPPTVPMPSKPGYYCPTIPTPRSPQRAGVNLLVNEQKRQ